MDFPNGTFQGASYGLSLLLANNCLPAQFDARRMQQRIEGMIAVVPKLVDRQGALGEALPNEGSFCVTGLVLGDCLGALATLGDRLKAKRRENLVQGLAPLAEFLTRQDETHGIISNHLATNALAMARWSAATGDTRGQDRAALWVERIKSHAHDEGWMREYDGADPGYQSWCTSALAQIAVEAPELDVAPLVEKSFEFLQAFALSDGRFASGCGSRLTRFLMPGGAEIYADQSNAAAQLAVFARRNAQPNTFVTLDAIDEPNIVPFFNDMVLAAIHAKRLDAIEPPEPRTTGFPAAGLYVHCGSAGQFIINSDRGGWITRSSQEVSQDFPEPVAKRQDGTILRPVRGQIKEHSGTKMIVHADLEPVNRMLPSPGKFVVLRLLSLTVFRSARMGNLVKRLLARLLLSETGRTVSRVERIIDLESATVSDRVIAGEAELVENPHGFSPMHMASQGYWQLNDDTSSES